ncbi:MAG TPA: hypothetical protein DEG17_08425 [Cyanobacteria bacterium UBA11149]|nr:hypothetical protein [Cyanobacteria bacterium UBA11367]HBE59742.1 hypothetical protein [Cyanobacteria bacterium UBA11366]HBK65349.1 hypothetical protein [Cyanobacteria bacterium UBA11166]HBR76572.1 hypothetical protein [Cyanobacteria bacterium UBA11159]HBS68175.1 hypothetical protein [Cyanobacteria bacterium UBA11153]HBW88884.1 hypothetical protein [Cyanobacteria bacterium UBA11149]HCA94583.1 hypothetical protein [Cyanobacteria bacterium UBA9226]
MESKDTPNAIPQNTTSNSPIFQAIVNFFTANNWHFTQIEAQSALYLTFPGNNGEYDCYAQAREEQKQFIFYSACPTKVPKPKRRAVAEFISRANYGTIVGNFELDFNDGEIRYKTHSDLKYNFLLAEAIKELVYTNIMMMDRYLPGITSVISGKVSPEEAICAIEPIEILPQPFADPLSNNLTENQLPPTTNQKKKVKSQSSPSISSGTPSAKLPTESDIFCRLTRAEISQFAEIKELQRNKQKTLVQTKLEQLKNGLKNRLGGEEGEAIFEQTDEIFQTHDFDIKQIRFIGRYLELYGLIEFKIEELLTQNSEENNLTTTIEGWQKMKIDIKQRVQQISEYYIYPQQEIDMLVEIEEIRGELMSTKNH